MSRLQSPRWLLAIVPAALLPVLLPLAVRNWALIREGSPIWLLMLGQALAVIAAAIFLAWIGAILVARRAGRADG